MDFNNKILSDFEVWTGFPGSGVYMVCAINLRTKFEVVYYVGSAKNIFNRTMSQSHHFRKIYNRMDRWGRAIYIRIIPDDLFPLEDRRQVEIQAIKYFKPLLNIHHNE